MLAPLLLSFLSALLLILSLPPYNQQLLAALALTPLLLAIHQTQSARRRLLLGELTGIVYWFAVCTWIQFVLEVHGGLGKAGGWATFLLFCILKAIQLAVFTWLAGYLLPKAHALITIPALWVVIERTHGTFGFAWLPLGNAVVDLELALRLAPFTGVYGVSFLLAIIGTALALAILRRPPHQYAPALIVPIVLLLLPPLDPGPTPTRTAIAVQPNIPTEAEWDQRHLTALETRMAALSLEGLRKGPADILLWPEAPAPLYYERDPHFRQQATTLAQTTRLPFLFGTVAYTSENAPLNSAQLLNPNGFPAGRYDKINLVPFGEFVPAPFGWVNRITQEISDFRPGTTIRTFPLPGLNIGPFICYESVFPHFVRQFVHGGAEVLVNLSNDSYFGNSAARYQHLAIVRMRAIENHRWILRATNDGITASISPTGAVIRPLPDFAQGVARLPFSPLTGQTLYTRASDWFVLACAALLLLVPLMQLITKRP